MGSQLALSWKKAEKTAKPPPKEKRVKPPPPEETEDTPAHKPSWGTWRPMYQEKTRWGVRDTNGVWQRQCTDEVTARATYAALEHAELCYGCDIWWRGPEPDRYFEPDYNPGDPPDLEVRETK